MAGQNWIDYWYCLGPYVALSVDMEMPAINKHPPIETIVYTGSIFCKVTEPWPNTCQTPATVNDLKKDIKENIDRYEDILNHLVGVYAAKPTKYDIEMDELTKKLWSHCTEKKHTEGRSERSCSSYRGWNEQIRSQKEQRRQRTQRLRKKRKMCIKLRQAVKTTSRLSPG